MTWFNVNNWLVLSIRAIYIACGKYALPTAMKHEGYEWQKLQISTQPLKRNYVLGNYWSP